MVKPYNPLFSDGYWLCFTIEKMKHCINSRDTLLNIVRGTTDPWVDTITRVTILLAITMPATMCNNITAKNNFFFGRHFGHHASHLVGHHASPHAGDHAGHLVGHHVQQHVNQDFFLSAAMSVTLPATLLATMPAPMSATMPATLSATMCNNMSYTSMLATKLKHSASLV